MSAVSPLADHRPTSAPGWVLPVVRTTSAILAVSLVVQAFLGSSGFFQARSNLVTVHEMLGNAVFLVAIGLVVSAFVAVQNGLFDRGLLIVAIIILVLVVAQTGLGYAGRTNLDAMALHLPNGVLLMGACTWATALAFGPRRHRTAP